MNLQFVHALKQKINAVTIPDGLGKVLGWTAICFQWIFRLRKIFLSIPVLYYAVRLTVYNNEALPQTVGVLLQPDGSFLVELTHSFAVFVPFGITIGCLTMMFLSRKALYAWAISFFSLALPVLLLISNIYPA